MGRRCLARREPCRELTHVARQVAEIANLAADAHAPYVGRSAFAHKGGVHVAAIRRLPRAYEHIDPALVGNETRVVVSELSGRGNVLAKAEEHDVALEAGSEADGPRRPEGARSARLRVRGGRGVRGAPHPASRARLRRRRSSSLDYRVTVGQRRGEGAFADAAIKIRVRGQVVHTAAEGNGPVSALDAALRKALAAAYPEVDAHPPRGLQGPHPRRASRGRRPPFA